MATNSIGREIIPFSIVNNSGSGQPAFLYMFGNTDSVKPEGNTYYVSNLKGDCTKFPPSKQGQVYGLELPKDLETKAFFPQLDAMRVYISFEKQLSIDTNAEGIPIAVSADVESPNFDCLWDFVEGTWHDYGDRKVLHMNTTQVDAFGLAFKLEHSGLDPRDNKTPLTIVNGFDSDKARSGIIGGLSGLGAPWSKLVVAGGRRALMPLKSMDRGDFPKDQLVAYLNQIAQYYERERFKFSYNGVTYIGGVQSGKFVFTPDKAKDNGGNPTKIYVIASPTTRQCYAQDIKSTPDDGVGSALCAALGASVLRSTLTHQNYMPVPQEERSKYYVNEPICQYAKIIHAYGIDRHAFCYGYDEVAGDAGTNRDVVNPTSVKLTVLKV